MITALTYFKLLEAGKFLQISFIFLIIDIAINQNNMNEDGIVLGVNALRVRGEFDLNQDFFVFLAKFGFQKTDIRDPNNTQGVIYGNITVLPKSGQDFEMSVDQNGTKEYNSSQMPSRNHVTLAVLDRGYFLEFYGNRSVFDKGKACEKMFNKISTVAYDSKCYSGGEEDFLRSVPCQKGEICPDEDNQYNVVSKSQLTYRIQDLVQSRFWYVSMVACIQNESTCKWEHVKAGNLTISYDLTLVNGNPESTHHRHYFQYHFSYDTQDLLKVYLLLLALYTILTPVQFSAAVKQKHPITRLLTAALMSEYFALLLTSIHYGLFAINGEGISAFNTLGDVMEIFSQSIFMLLLILLSMGWAVTRHELTCKIALFSLWSLYTIVHYLLYIWKKFEVDVIEDIEEYQTVPGIIILVLRVIVMLVFLAALRDTMAHEYTPERIDFFLHFGAASLVWFIYLPIVAGIALRISKLWRAKFLIGIIYSADTFAYIVLMHLLWPSRSEQYYLLAIEDDHDDELEEFSQSANHLHDINKNKKSNAEEAGKETEMNRIVVSNLIDLQPMTKKDDGKCDNGSEKTRDNTPIIVENLNLKIIE